MTTGLRGVNANDPEFSLGQAFWRAKIHQPGRLLVNWHRLDDVDEIAFGDFARYFTDLWYPSSDDIDLFDETVDWLVAISHDGEVAYRRN